jgi:hypothetical protein
MITSVGIAFCIVAIAGSVKLTAFEHSRLRKDRQLGYALRLALIRQERSAVAARERGFRI